MRIGFVRYRERGPGMVAGGDPSLLLRLTLWVLVAEAAGAMLAALVARGEGVALAHLLQPVINALPG